MESEGAVLYVGTFRHNLDAKLRVTIPSKWRFKGDQEDSYLAWPHPEGYIAVYPPRMIERFRQRMEDVKASDSQGQKIMRNLFGKAHWFGCDNQGRIKLDEKLVQHAGIEKTAALVGVGETFNVWAAERFEAQDEEDFDLLQAMKDFGI